MIKEIKVLGTYSPYSKFNHNCPGFLVITDKVKILLDCGNGTLRLLNFPHDLKDLHVIISHMHNDHFGDLGSLQYASYTHHNLGMIEDKITIYLPSASDKFTTDLNTDVNVVSYKENHFTSTLSDTKILGVISEKFSFSDYMFIEDFTQENNQGCTRIGDVLITFLKTSHSENSYAIKIEDKNNIKIVYTSDISFRDKSHIVDFSSEADILICESSFIKEHGFPKYCSHLTAEQAATIAKSAKVKKLILTHFWPEEDISKYLDEAIKIFAESYIAQEETVYIV